MFSREPIYSALFDLLTVSSGFQFVTVSRKLKLWDDVPKDQRPALFFYQGQEEARGAERGTPPVCFLNVKVFIYLNTTDAEVPSRLLNDALDVVDAALKPDNLLSGRTTLGGLCDHVYKDGTTIAIPGDLDGDGIAIVPIKIRVA